MLSDLLRCIEQSHSQEVSSQEHQRCCGWVTLEGNRSSLGLIPRTVPCDFNTTWHTVGAQSTFVSLLSYSCFWGSLIRTACVIARPYDINSCVTCSTYMCVVFISIYVYTSPRQLSTAHYALLLVILKSSFWCHYKFESWKISIRRTSQQEVQTWCLHLST